MSSPTKVTECRRANKIKKAGRARKLTTAKKGSTKTTEELFKVVTE